MSSLEGKLQVIKNYPEDFPVLSVEEHGEVQKQYGRRELTPEELLAKFSRPMLHPSVPRRLFDLKRRLANRPELNFSQAPHSKL